MIHMKIIAKVATESKTQKVDYENDCPAEYRRCG
jgi:hypothetical protein